MGETNGSGNAFGSFRESNNTARTAPSTGPLRIGEWFWRATRKFAQIDVTCYTDWLNGGGWVLARNYSKSFREMIDKG
jgi:hypothetical protein